MDKNNRLYEFYKPRLEELGIKDGGKDILERQSYTFRYKNRKYALSIEFNKCRPDSGIYYGCKCVKTLKGDDLYIDKEWEKLNATIQEQLDKVLLPSNFDAGQEQYWPFWIRLQEEECYSAALNKLARIREILQAEPDVDEDESTI